MVDDAPLQRDIAQRILEMLDYQVRMADSGEAAVAYLKEHKVDLVLLDMIMGEGMDGLDTYRAIRDIHPGQKAIIASGFAGNKKGSRSPTAGSRDIRKKTLSHGNPGPGHSP